VGAAAPPGPVCADAAVTQPANAVAVSSSAVACFPKVSLAAYGVS
jgi:hypothetical protein